MLHIVVCDDEAAFAENLTRKIEALPAFSPRSMRVCCLTDPEALPAQPCDLLFLDIALVQANGVDVGRFIRNELNDMEMHIVYISSKQNYAMQLFKIQPLDFLIKPVPEDQLREVLSRSIRQRRDSGGYFEYQKGGSVLCGKSGFYCGIFV